MSTIPRPRRARHRGVLCRSCRRVVAALVPVQLRDGRGTRACQDCRRVVAY